MNAYQNIEVSLNYIEQHLNEKIETEELAEIACLSKFYYQRLFKRLIRKSVHEYIKLRRLAVAAKALRNSEERILDIALQCGFSDHANFTRAFKDAYHITPDEYRRDLPMLNTFAKPELSSYYTAIDENIPLIAGGIVLEIQRKTAVNSETYFGLEKAVNAAGQIPVGESTGIDAPGQLWREFHAQKMDDIFDRHVELGVSHSADPDKGTFLYFAGGMVSSTAVCPEHMIRYTLPAGEYVVCRIEAESFEELVTTALDQAIRYLFETWLPRRKLITKPFMAEKYYQKSAAFSYMEIWLMPE